MNHEDQLVYPGLNEIEDLQTPKELQTTVDTTNMAETTTERLYKAMRNVGHVCVYPFQREAPSFMSSHYVR